MRLVGKTRARGVRQINGSLHAVTKAEFLGQFDGQFAGGKDMPGRANALDQFAAIMRKHLGLHRFHDVWPAQIDLFGAVACRWGFG